MFIQISRETMLLLINYLHKNVRDNCSFNLRRIYGKHSTGKFFLALLYRIIQRYFNKNYIVEWNFQAIEQLENTTQLCNFC